ncbi:MAG: hypothetical protein M3063_05445 [Actinomycetota bacterium]|nr:hypothetical protein [Actinomycetota bacterium]
MLAAGVLLAACGGGGPTSPTAGPSSQPPPAVGSVSTTAPGAGQGGPATTTGPGRPFILVQDYAIAALNRAGLPAKVIAALFDNPRTLLIVKGKSSFDRSLSQASPVESFTSYGDIQRAFDTGAVAANIKYVLYDNEQWSFTPTAEQRDPVTYAQRAAAVVHEHGRQLIFAPAANLATVLSGGSPDQKFDRFLTLRLAGEGARVSDVLEIQAQQAEATPAFDPFVGAAVQQARLSNPNAVILVGLSTNPAGRAVTTLDLVSAFNSTRGMVGGYWLNVPGKSPKCPSCGEAQAGVGVGFVQAVAGALTG